MASKLTTLAAAIATCAVTATAQASLVYVGVIDISGSGFGNSLTILTIQDGNDELLTAEGSVAPDGPDAGTALDTTGEVKTGSSQLGTPSLADFGLTGVGGTITSTSQLRIIYNADQPAGGTVTLDNLILSLYTGTGATRTEIFNSGAFASQTFATTFSGVGNAGYVFRLDAEQAAAADLAASPFSYSNVLVGLSARVLGDVGGPETLVGYQGPGFLGTGTPVPLPGTLMLLGLGALALGASMRRRQG
ncbi:MAG TPA: PEP-CTERM sorting domain-containing protein [Burkholderiaceae bacterium]|nr:PEP-CTERM sorting domain-containing protein [Burkholderiaceae bacterium]